VVLSTERSGSTLLSVMLGGHSRIAAPPELHLLRYADFDGWRTGYPIATGSLLSLVTMLGLPGDPGVLEARFHGWRTPSIYRWLLDRAPADHLLVDKTPAYGRSDRSLERAEQLRPLYLWLVRHPLGVAASRIERRRQRRRADQSAVGRLQYAADLVRRAVGGTAVEVRREVEHWVEVHHRIGRFLEGVEPNRWRRIHFEQLVRQPREEIAALSEWLGVSVEPPMLEPTSHLPENLQWGVGDEKVREHTGIDPAVADRWREAFSESVLATEALALMDRLGVKRGRSR